MGTSTNDEPLNFERGSAKRVFPRNHVLVAAQRFVCGNVLCDTFVCGIVFNATFVTSVLEIQKERGRYMYEFTN